MARARACACTCTLYKPVTHRHTHTWVVLDMSESRGYRGGCSILCKEELVSGMCVHENTSLKNTTRCSENCRLLAVAAGAMFQARPSEWARSASSFPSMLASLHIMCVHGCVTLLPILVHLALGI